MGNRFGGPVPHHHKKTHSYTPQKKMAQTLLLLRFMQRQSLFTSLPTQHQLMEELVVEYK